MNRIIAHLDMDAFFAAIEERDYEWLRGLPIVVGADPKNGKGRGVVSTANYKARAYGIRSAMPISKAWRLSEMARNQGKPPANFLLGSFKRYRETSDRIMQIIRNRVSVVNPARGLTSNGVEQASIDEIYLELSFTGSFEKARKLCEELKKEIQDKEKLTASVGIGPNKLIAKIASDQHKPDGLTVVGNDDDKICAEFVEAFLDPMPIRALPGIGPKTEILLNKRGIRIIKDLKRFSREELQEMLGKWGLELYRKARGQSDSPVSEDHETKSIGEQETFEKDTLDSKFLFERLGAMCETVLNRLAREGFSKFRTVVITVRFADFQTQTRSHTLSKPTSDLKTIHGEALKLLLPFLDRRENPRRKPIRLLGIRVEKLE